MCNIFAQFGIPENVVFDNGPTFTSMEFKQLLQRNGVRHTTSPPYHPASNGLAERAVQIFKHSVAKLTDETVQTKIVRFLFTYRTPPQSTTGMSPSELLLGRRFKSALDLMKLIYNIKLRRNKKDRKLHMTVEQLIEHLILEKKFMQEIMVKERSGYQPR